MSNFVPVLNEFRFCYYLPHIRDICVQWGGVGWGVEWLDHVHGCCTKIFCRFLLPHDTFLHVFHFFVCLLYISVELTELDENLLQNGESQGILFYDFALSHTPELHSVDLLRWKGPV